MSNRSWAPTYAALVLTWALAGPVTAADNPKETASSEVFGLTKVWDFHLELSAREWEQMQRVSGMRFPGGPPGPGGRPGFPGPGGPPQPADQPGDKPADTHKNGGFGMEFPWASGTLTAEGKTYKNVGIRYKGNASYMASSRGLKRNFKIDLDHFDEALRFHGLKTINLNAGAMDPTKGRESLSFAVFRAAGVPAPRTAYARVTLTVPGKYDKELLGLYTVVEQVDRTFLKDRFQSKKGLLMKPERLRGIEYLGEDWKNYKDRYQPKHEPSKNEAKRVIAFARLVNRADDEQFRKEIGAYLDVDEFLRFMAVNALLVNLDSFFMLGHNYYMYLHPETNKIVFIPWDMDLSLAGFPMGGAPDQQLDLSLMHPYSGDNKLIDRLFAMSEVKEKYQKLLREQTATCFAREKLLKEIETLEATTKPILAAELKAAAARKEGGGFRMGGPGMMGPGVDLRTFVAKRTELVAAQLNGKSKGYVPARGFGPGGPPGGPGRMGLGNMLARPLLETLDTDKDGQLSKEELVAGARKLFEMCDKDRKGKLDGRAFAEVLNRLLPPPPGFGPRGGPGGPGGFGPGMMLAGVLVQRADADKDGQVTVVELVAAVEAFFQECDKDKKGKLDEKAVAGGLNRLLPPPPGFGPPEGRPAEPRKEPKP